MNEVLDTLVLIHDKPPSARKVAAMQERITKLAELSQAPIEELIDLATKLALEVELLNDRLDEFSDEVDDQLKKRDWWKMRAQSAETYSQELLTLIDLK